MIDTKVAREGEHVEMLSVQAVIMRQTFAVRVQLGCLEQRSLYDLVNASDQHG